MNSRAAIVRLCRNAGGCTLVIGLLFGGLTSSGAEQRLPLRVRVDTVSKGDVYPVTGGVPFPPRALARSDGIRLLDAHGNDVPVQTEVLATWDREGQQVKWLLIDFQVSLDSRESDWSLVYGPDVKSSRGPDRVDPNQSRWPPAMLADGLYMSDQNGRMYRSEGDRDRDMVIETSGPLRTAVRVNTWHLDERGNRLCRAILRLHYYAGLEQVRVFHSFVMDADPETVKIGSMGLKLPLSVDRGRRLLLAGEQATDEVVEAETPSTITQADEERFWIRGSTDRAGRRSGMWLVAPSRDRMNGVFLRDGWQEYPKQLAYDGHVIDIALWPRDVGPPLDLGAIPREILTPDTERALHEGLTKNPAGVSLYRYVTKGQTDWFLGTTLPRIRQGRDWERQLFPDRPAYYYLVFGHNGRGTLKTHEFVLAELQEATQPRQVATFARTVSRPPVLTVSPQWSCASSAIGSLVPYASGPFRETDYVMTYAEYADHQTAVERYRLYGAMNWGDYLNGNPATAGPLVMAYGDDPQLRLTDRIGWMNTESHDSVVGPWLQFLRTASPRLFYLAEAQTEHVATVDHQHTFPARGAHHAATFYHALRHYDGGVAPSHAVTGGILLGYYLTGDRALRDTVVAAADHWVAEQEQAGNGWYAGTDPSRQNSAPFTAVLNAYTLTWNENYLASIDEFLDSWAPVFDVRKHYLGGTLPYPGALFLAQVPHPRLQATYQTMMVALRDEMDIDGQSAYYLPGMAYLYERTGDLTYAAYCQFVLEWHQHAILERGYSDLVARVRRLGVADFAYGMVSGYLASGISAVARAEGRGGDIEAAMKRLRAQRAAARNHKDTTADPLQYNVVYFDDEPLSWLRED